MNLLFVIYSSSYFQRVKRSFVPTVALMHSDLTVVQHSLFTDIQHVKVLFSTVAFCYRFAGSLDVR